ncbi:TetR/AcrR family transcriptional regulator [Pikeienuella sp. HZG-20]|uniref:TetR/AcrR family transcriptional regulator n=1 Tax=Paludibacillus litoralis TaxID=3133267 RepID=UPI0030EF88BC
MGRPRALERDEILDAAEAAARRLGAARLTLGAVAAEAGVSKATVLYDFKSKDGLIGALIERRLAAESAESAAFRAALGPDARDAAIRAHVARAGRAPTEEERAVILSFAAALARQNELAEPIRAHYAHCVRDIMDTSTEPRGAFLAFLALEGLHCLERFDVFRLDAENRRRVLADIAWLAEQAPAAPESEGASRCDG